MRTIVPSGAGLNSGRRREQSRRLLPAEDSIALADRLAANGHPAAALAAIAARQKFRGS